MTVVLVLNPTTDCTAVVNRLHDNNWLDSAFTANDTADTSYALSRPEVYPVLRKQRRLPDTRYVGWLAATFPPRSGRRLMHRSAVSAVSG